MRLLLPLAALPLLLPGQITSPPEFDANGDFLKSGEATVDGTSHTAAEHTRIRGELLAQLARLPGHQDGVRMIEAKEFQAAAKVFHTKKLPIGEAVAQYLGGSPEKGAATLLEAVAGAPEARVWAPFLGEMAGGVPSRAGDFRAALEAIVKARPKEEPAQFYLGHTLLLEEPPKQREALAAFAQAAALAPKETRALMAAARELTAQGKRPQAIAMLQKAIARNPGLATAHFRLAALYRITGDTARSKQHLDRYLELRER